MGTTTNISWTDRTWNPWRGCTKISAGCAHCYMFTQQTFYGNDPKIVVRTQTWKDPLRWQRQAAAGDERRKVFTCSWSDWWHPTADDWRPEAWQVIRECPDLIFQILTKRDDRTVGLPEDWPLPNVWLGVSVENKRQGLPRIDTLREIPAAIRFLSVEPLLMDLGEIDLTGIDWVIVGGESGPHYRPMRPEWAESVRVQCQAAGVPFWFKQAAGPRPGAQPDLLGRVYQEMPPLPPLRGQASLFGEAA